MSKYDNLVIVESNAKAKIIKNYLNSIEELKKLGNFNVIASFGHIRDLQKKNKGIDIDNDFKPIYETALNDEFKVKVLKQLKDSIKKSKVIWLAADCDREGEAIAWHIKDYFKIKNYKRITFNEITKDALKYAVLHPRKIDMKLVQAQEARRFIDRIVGFDISPILWKTFNTSTVLSAGRVQSATLNIIINRENEINKFKSKSYYMSAGNFKIDKYDIEDAKFNVDNKLKQFSSSDKAYKFLKDMSPNYVLDNINKSVRSNKPPPPFITSSLQQVASGQLKSSIKQVMAMAQVLYEAGYITYMRTDSYNLSDQILGNISKFIKNNYGDNYLLMNQHNKKSKNSQEAHEAIRPSNINTKSSDLKGKNIDSSHKKLYDLIWKRTIASQMQPARFYDISLNIQNSSFKKMEYFVGKFKIYFFEGYLKLYGEKADANFNIDKFIEDITNKKSSLKMINILAKNIWSTPQQRYSESSIVKTLECDGIGRPSTYSNIISKLYDKRYIEKKDMLGDIKEYVNYILYPNKKIKEEKEKRNLTDEKSKLVPSDVGIQINNFMLKQFAPIVDSNFTSEIEEDFDKIANGNKKFLNVMNSFYKDFSKLTKSTEVKIKKTDKIKLESYQKEIKLDNKKYIIRIAKYGPVIQFKEFNKKENKDENKYINLVPYLKATGKDIESINKDDIKLLINLPMKIGKTNNKDIILKYARYGFYLSNGNKNASIFKQYIGLVLDGEFNKIKKLIDNEKIKFK